MMRTDQPHARRSGEAHRRYRLATKLSLSVGGLLVVLTGGVTLLTFMQARGTALAALERQADAMAGTLNYTFGVLLDAGEVFHTQRIAANSALLPSVRSVVIASLDGRVIAGTPQQGGQPVESSLLRVSWRKGRSSARCTSATAMISWSSTRCKVRNI